MEDLLGVLQAADHNGDLGLGGDLKHPGAEMVDLSVVAGVALGEDTHGDLIRLQQLDAFQDGFQGLPVVFPVDVLAHDLVHQVADDEHMAVLLFGDKSQLGLGEGSQQHHRVQNAQMVAHQQEPALLGKLLRPLDIHLHAQQTPDGGNIGFDDPAVKPAVVLLGHLLIHQGGSRPQK